MTPREWFCSIILGFCLTCDKETSRRCSQCSADLFCSIECQEFRGSISVLEHITDKCTVRRLSAHKLFLFCLRNEIPTDGETEVLFSFDKFSPVLEKTCLLRLYIWLFCAGVTVEHISQWSSENNLSDNILAEYENNPGLSKSDLFIWFQKSLNRFNSVVCEDREDLPGVYFAKSCLEPAEQNTNVSDLYPDSKRRAFIFYAQMVSGDHAPFCQSPAWFDFGFVTCRNCEEETMVGVMYQTLLGTIVPPEMNRLPVAKFPTDYVLPARCTFTDFWMAFHSGALPDLLRQHNLGYQLGRIRHLAAFLQAPTIHTTSFSSGNSPAHPSVWMLKVHLELGSTQPTGSVHVDYGFINCGDPRLRLELCKIYREVLRRADPLDLHQACLENNLWRFCGTYCPISQSFERYMKNIYPLEKDHRGIWRLAGTTVADATFFGLPMNEKQAAVLNAIWARVICGSETCFFTESLDENPRSLLAKTDFFPADQ
ncbi:hypothetical protein BDP27DRAFT_328954 [Rhodocollybia butyracea]|uniref:MYND-type domain-containing protein n=1 Tax=Rhodocollybia butyracea TaxID=206335 RepID=A0A9P5QAS8_9AGAR|nr:hypothetical protein BDP27DRAFT_328954 [Rhodocollybia butyracea]